MRAPIKAYSWQKYWILKAHRLARWWLAAPVPGRGLHPDRTRRISSEDWNGGWQLLCWADVSPSLTGDLKEFQRFGFFCSIRITTALLHFVHPYKKFVGFLLLNKT